MSGKREFKTDKKIKEALGGILFIDEAYSLFKGDGSGWGIWSRGDQVFSSKGWKTIEDDFVVIVAWIRPTHGRSYKILMKV